MNPTTQTFTIVMGININFNEIGLFSLGNNCKILFLKYKTNIQKSSEFDDNLTPKKHFQNSMTLLVKIDSHIINIKLSQNGTMQLTGCKHYYDPLLILHMFWLNLKKPSLEAHIICYMTNIGFSVGFHLNREKLRQEFLNQSSFDAICMNEPFYSYPGLVVKMPITHDQIINQHILKVNYTSENNELIDREKFDQIYQSFIDNGNCQDCHYLQWTRYKEFLDILSKKGSAKKIKSRYITFLIFSSGQVIMSSTSLQLIHETISTVREFIISRKDKIME